MRYGFFNGIGGDLAALRDGLALFAGCDRIVSLGDLMGGSAEGDLACWREMETLGPKALVLGGAGERLRSRDRSIPEEVRSELRGLLAATVEEGIAILGSPAAARAGSRAEFAALGGAPRLVAPITISSHSGDTRLWRASGGLARVVEVEAGASLPLPRGAEQLWLELGRKTGDRPVYAIIDLHHRRLELHELSASGRSLHVPRLPRATRRRKVDARQGLLAV